MGKTRKQRGGSLANTFASLFSKKKGPVTTNTSESIQTTKNNTTVMYGRKQNLQTFVKTKQKKANLAKRLRNHTNRLKGLSNAVRNESLRLMNNNLRNKTRKLLNFKNINALSNDQIIELYTTGKVRSLSQ